MSCIFTCRKLTLRFIEATGFNKFFYFTAAQKRSVILCIKKDKVMGLSLWKSPAVLFYINLRGKKVKTTNTEQPLCFTVTLDIIRTYRHQTPQHTSLVNGPASRWVKIAGQINTALVLLQNQCLARGQPSRDTPVCPLIIRLSTSHPDAREHNPSKHTTTTSDRVKSKPRHPCE